LKCGSEDAGTATTKAQHLCSPSAIGETGHIDFHAGAPFADSLNSRSTLHVSLTNPAATAGVVFNVMWGRQKLYHATNSANISSWFSHFFENAFVNRVKRRFCIRIVSRRAGCACGINAIDEHQAIGRQSLPDGTIRVSPLQGQEPPAVLFTTGHRPPATDH
jgi:hypothetical protein